MMSAGRPLIFSTSEELEECINNYFNGEMRIKTIIVGGFPQKVPVPTITGLAIHLGFESRQSLYDYEKREEFSYTIKRARLFIEREYEEQLQVGNTTGAIFALKNMGWKDKTEVENTNLNITTTEPPLSIEEAKRKLDELNGSI
jgi:hypothetical protein